MKTCNDCMYYDFCRFHDYSLHNNRVCEKFKDKSKFIELPCSVGDYCIWHDNLWYVNVICYSGDKNGDFLLWMSMADKSPCGAEAVSSEVKFISEEEAQKKLEELNNEKERT